MAGTRLAGFLVDSSSRSVNITSLLMRIITHHPLHAMMTKYAADRTSPLAQANEEFHSKNPAIVGSCVMKNRDS